MAWAISVPAALVGDRMHMGTEGDIGGGIKTIVYGTAYGVAPPYTAPFSSFPHRRR